MIRQLCKLLRLDAGYHSEFQIAGLIDPVRPAEFLQQAIFDMRSDTPGQ